MAASAQLLTVEQIQASGLTKAQAKQVLLLVLQHQGVNLKKKGIYIDDDLQTPSGKPMRPGYYDFSLNYDSPSAGATDVMGSYSVSIVTGDVWENESCKRYQFTALTKLQALIAAKTGASMPSEDVARESVGC